MLRRIARRIWLVVKEEYELARTRAWLRNRDLIWPSR